MDYPVTIFYSEEDQGFIAVVSDLPGCSAFGETQEEALKQVQAARNLWLEVAQKEGRLIPEPSEVAVEQYS